jgi:hypothetical protein
MNNFETYCSYRLRIQETQFTDIDTCKKRKKIKKKIKINKINFKKFRNKDLFRNLPIHSKTPIYSKEVQEANIQSSTQKEPDAYNKR